MESHSAQNVQVVAQQRNTERVAILNTEQDSES